MKRTSPVDMRKALAMAHEMSKAGLLFVPMPVVSPEEFATLARHAHERLGQIAEAAEGGSNVSD